MKKLKRPLTHFELIPLALAAYEGDLEEVKRLAQETPHEFYKQRDEMDEYLPIHCAVVGNELSVVQWMFEQDPTLITKHVGHGESCLDLAVIEDDLEMAQWLISKCRPLLYSENSHTALAIHHAAFTSLKMVKWLVSEDPDLFTAHGDFYDIYPIHIAAAAGKIDIMAWILEKDPSMLRKINTEGELPIHYAIYAQDTTSLEFLLSQIWEKNPALAARRFSMYNA